MEHLNPQRHGKWSSAEDSQLKQAVEAIGEGKWQQVAFSVPGRSPIQCLHRWTKRLKPGLVRGPWTVTEDDLLKNWVAKQGANSWSACSAQIPGRNGKQCRERWLNSLSPDVKRGDWSEEEDAIILRCYEQLGPKWTLVAQSLPGRTDNAIKNRFYASLRKNVPNAQLSAPRGSGSEETAEIKLVMQLQKLEMMMSAVRSQMDGIDGEVEQVIGKQAEMS
jgi:hypothetical protein